MGKTLDKILKKLDGYLVSIERNLDTDMYELKVGFRKNWVYKSTDDIECDVVIEAETGSVAIISGKHEEVIIDDLVDFVNKVIDTNKKITQMQEEFEDKLEEQKQLIADQILQFEEEIEEMRETSFKDEEEVEPTKKSSKNTKEKEEVFIDEDVVQKIS
jgi:hypothetical protein